MRCDKPTVPGPLDYGSRVGPGVLGKLMPVGWLRRHKWIVGAAVLATSVLIGVGIWFLLVGYIEPNDPTGRKDVVQVFALIVAGIVGIIAQPSAYLICASHVET